MNENNFGNGKVRPWAVIKDGGTGYISAVKRASGQVAKVRKVASSNPAVWEDRRVDKDKNLLPILRGNKKSNWGGILPEFDHPPGGGELFNYAKTLDKLQKKFPDERQYKLAKASLDDEIRNFNLKPATSTHNAAERVWDDTKGLMVKDC
ncbi:hypothetical protein LMH87_001637 [Akanthomyces muscarius]|uniref:Uncharacterized protein n=1 Tax=Akanthomyces muscarius TaxID=2231603 RepID=A0A9W8Q582_AKAMU|nr:hypothetical protein LMH87_001637 [Akanthomyces muscarius]KAJ4147089.1 hypothetical protein LMH87_001637 [Akanthomyces muscarius]